MIVLRIIHIDKQSRHQYNQMPRSGKTQVNKVADNDTLDVSDQSKN